MRSRAFSLTVFVSLAACTRTSPQVAAAGAPPATAQDTVALYYAPPGTQPVQALRGVSQPRYPDVLRRSRVEGQVVAQYVVDTSGTVLPGSLRIARATDTLFAAAVRDALTGLRFSPATMNGRKVRQLVEQPIYFDMVDGSAKASRPPARRAVPTTDPTVRAPMVLGAIVITAVAAR